MHADSSWCSWRRGRRGLVPTLLLGVCLAAMAARSRAAEDASLDAVWTEVSRTVAQGDFEGYAALYHPDAVLVAQSSGKSVPIADAFARWKAGFDETKAGKARASVEFRITRRLAGATTAHDTGIFHYRFQAGDAAPEDAYVHFESLLVRKPEGWKMLMEYQKAAATPEEWNAAAASAQQQAPSAERSP